MSDKKLILSNYAAFGIGCLVIVRMVMEVVHHWGTWKAWMFGILGLVNVVTLSFMIVSHLRWFDSRMTEEYFKSRVDLLRDLQDDKDCTAIKSDI